jgi:hypothetical protein
MADTAEHSVTTAVDREKYRVITMSEPHPVCAAARKNEIIATGTL